MYLLYKYTQTLLLCMSVILFYFLCFLKMKKESRIIKKVKEKKKEILMK